jgi:hypothetical protein
MEFSTKAKMWQFDFGDMLAATSERPPRYYVHEGHDDLPPRLLEHLFSFRRYSGGRWRSRPNETPNNVERQGVISTYIMYPSRNLWFRDDQTVFNSD